MITAHQTEDRIASNLANDSAYTYLKRNKQINYIVRVKSIN